MPRNYTVVTGTVSIDSEFREKEVHILGVDLDGTPSTLGSSTSDPITGQYSVPALRERNAYMIGVANTKYGAVWSESMLYAIGDRVLPATQTNHWYECTVAGTSGATEPVWTTDGTTLVDGTVTWIDKGICENPIARGPFTMPDPSPDPDVIHLVRYQDKFLPDEVSNANATRFGNPQLNRSIKKWGGSSLEFNGTTDYLSYPPISPSGNFTIDIWVRPTAVPDSNGAPAIAIGDLNTDSHRIVLWVQPDMSAEFYCQEASSTVTADGTGTTIALHEWSLLSGEKYNGTYYLYVNGVLVTSAASAVLVVPTANAQTYVGTGRLYSGQRYYEGFVGEHRISNVARYQGTSFALPTSPWVV